MSTISTLNVVVQQGNSAHEMQQTRQQSPEHTQILVSQQQGDKEVEKRLTVQQTGEMEEGRIREDGSGKGRHVLRQKKKRKAAAGRTELGATGRLLDTVA